MFGTSIYQTWCSMLKRCRDENHKSYKNYGGRGITVCKKWLKFENFYNDVGDRPSRKYTLERIDNNKGYFPNNIKWATMKEQSNNSRMNVKIKYKDEKGEKNYVAYAPITCIQSSVNSSPWVLGIVMEEKEMIRVAESVKRSMNYTQALLIGLFIVILLAVSDIAYRMSRRITKPILDLDEGAKIVGGGNLDYQLEVRTGDEIEDLANAFSKMTSDLKAYMKDLEETTAAREHIQSELRIASEIQASMLPRTFPPFPDRKEFDIFATMEPAKEVGGDFYDFFFID